jgi:hypothetical protein
MVTSDQGGEEPRKAEKAESVAPDWRIPKSVPGYIAYGLPHVLS